MIGLDTVGSAVVGVSIARPASLVCEPGTPFRVSVGAGAGANAAAVSSAMSTALATASPSRTPRVARVAPLDACAFRIVPAPDTDAADAIALLELECEADFVALAPAHRRAAGVLPGPLASLAMLACWPESADIGGVSGGASGAALGGATKGTTSTLDAATVVPAPAALAALLAPGAGGAAVLIDPSSGTIIALHVAGVDPCVRCFVEDPSDVDAWAAGVARAVAGLPSQVADPARSIALDAVRADNEDGEASVRQQSLPRAAGGASGGARRVLLDPASVQALVARGFARAGDRAWLAEHALAIGAALVAGSADSRVRALATLRERAPREIAPIHVRALRWVAVPRNALVTIVVALILALGAPIGVAHLRLAILTAKTEGLESGKAQREQLLTQAAMFREIEGMRWPMTKLLSDLARATPVGIDVESIRMSPDTGVSVQGVATRADLVNQLESNLTASGVFGGVKVNRTSATASGVEFDISAQVRNPTAIAKLTEDFAANPIQSREGFVQPTVTAPAPRGTRAPGANGSASASSSSSNAGSSGASSSGSSGSSSGGGGASASAASRRPVADNTDPPAELTESAIAGMARPALSLEFARRRAFLQRNTTIDASTRQRLESEVASLRARLDATAATPAPAQPAPPRPAP